MMLFQTESKASLQDKGERIPSNSVYWAPTVCTPGSDLGARGTAVNKTDNPRPVADRIVRGEGLCTSPLCRKVNMTHREGSRAVGTPGEWGRALHCSFTETESVPIFLACPGLGLLAGRGTHLINHLVFSLPRLHILLKSLACQCDLGTHCSHKG